MDAQTLRQLLSTQPFVQLLGIEVVETGKGWVQERMPIRPDFLQPSVVHGGVLYSFADTAAAHAVLTLIYPGEWTTTVEQKINYLRPVTQGTVICHARVVHLGNRLAYVEAEIVNDSSELVAKSVATLMRIQRKQD